MHTPNIVDTYPLQASSRPREAVNGVVIGNRILHLEKGQ